MFGLAGVVSAVALSFKIAILVFVFIAFAGSAPIDKEILAFPAVLSYWGSSIFSIIFSVRLLAVNFVLSNLIALLLIFWRFWAIYTENGIVTRITMIKPNINIFLYDEKKDIKILQIYRI